MEFTNGGPGSVSTTESHGFYESVADKLQVAFGRSQPQLEVRFTDLTVASNVTTLQSRAQDLDGASPELPTIWNTLKHAVKHLVSTKKMERREILRGVSGILRPGTMTLVLGQPGSGKSTLLKALSGRLGDGLSVSGEITYNGELQHLLAQQLPLLAAYVPQNDEHFPLLSVKETLSFAHAFGVGDDNDIAQHATMLLGQDSAQHSRQALKSAIGMFENYPEVIKQQLGLQNCWDTVVGDNMVRGVSGGEKKRVTMGEMVLGMQRAVFMDEISTGLDSAATFDIVSTQRTIARTLGKTMVISLLQPPPDVFALFDDVILLNEGEILYYGPREKIVEYFRELGLHCPPNRDIADFLLDLSTPQQFVYESTAIGATKPPRLPSEYAEIFRSSDIHLSVLDHLNEKVDHSSLDKWSKYAKAIPKFQRSVWANTLTLVMRQLMLIMRDANTLRSRIVLVLVVAVVCSTAFMDVDPTNVPLVLGTIFMSAMFPLFEQTSQLSMFVGMRNIFYKQRSANFFQTSAYVLANVISQVPVALPEIFVYGAFMYWIAGLEADVGCFILYELIIFLTVMAAVLIFFFVAAISPNMYTTNPLALGILQVVLVFAGFVVTRSQIPDYLIWLYWLDPMAWAFRALAVNQYRSATFDVCMYKDINYCDQFGKTMGEYYLSVYDIPSEKKWVVFGIIYLIGLSLLFMVLSYFALEYKRYEGDFRAIRVTSSEDDLDNYQLATTPKTDNHATPFNSADSTVSIEVREHSRAFVPVTVAFKDLWYSVPDPSKPTESIDLLKGISGVARPGTITALMGSSGAGKTTLMDVIAGRKNTGSVRGKILLNGHEATELAIRRCTGYCEQTDIHSETATFREALTFSAFLRQDSDVPESAKIASVNEIVNLLGLGDIADHMVRGSSLEQLKRLTIGVELAAQPSVLFLDEPTSGLDARFAKMIMDGIRKVADSGRTVICTIHQPSYEVFRVFDNLLLLKRGGETVFFGELGEDCRALVDYFEAIPGVPPLPEAYNPATWMLECIGAGVNKSSQENAVDFVRRFSESTLAVHLGAVLQEEGVGRPSPHIPALAFGRKRAASSMVQMKLLTQRFFNMYWRTPAHYITILGVALGSVLVLGLVGSGLSMTSYQGICSGLGIIFVAFQFQGFVSFNSAIPFAFDDRAAFYRERSAQTYSALWYFVAQTLVEVPYVFTKGLIISALLFAFMGFTGVAKFLLFWLAVSLSVLIDVYTGHLLAFALPNIVMASLTGSVVSTIFFLFVGFNPPGSSISAGYQWLYTITPQRYAMSILSTLVYGECSTTPELDAATGVYMNVGPEIGCQPLEDAPVSIGNVTVKGLLEDVYNMHHDDIARDFGALLVFIIVFRVLSLLALQFLNYQKR